MRNEICIPIEEYLEIVKVLDKVICILDRSEKREDMDNRAYALAIACAKTDITAELTRVRKSVCQLITDEELCKLDDFGIFDYEIPEMPYDASLYELKEALRPFLVKYEKYIK